MASVNLQQAMTAYTNGKKVAEMSRFETPHLPGEGPDSVKPSFGNLVADSLRQSAANSYENEATSAKAIANDAELHDLVTTVANAELTLKAVVAIRDRVITAYQDIIKMPI